MAFFTSAINILQTLVVAIGAGLAVWGVINLLEGYTSITSLSHISKVTGNQAAYGRWRCRFNRYTACTITGEFILAGAVRKENTHG